MDQRHRGLQPNVFTTFNNPQMKHAAMPAMLMPMAETSAVLPRGASATKLVQVPMELLSATYIFRL